MKSNFRKDVIVKSITKLDTPSKELHCNDKLNRGDGYIRWQLTPYKKKWKPTFRITHSAIWISTPYLGPRRSVFMASLGTCKPWEQFSAMQTEAVCSIMLCTHNPLWTLGWWHDSPTKGSLFFCKSTVLLNAGRTESHWMRKRGTSRVVDAQWMSHGNLAASVTTTQTPRPWLFLPGSKSSPDWVFRPEGFSPLTLEHCSAWENSPYYSFSLSPNPHFLLFLSFFEL